ncbi:MAG: DUF5668 domain-containing protein [Cyclobacteriaceae bacterium]
MRTRRNGNEALGVLILVIGILLLVKQLGIFLPGWIFSWPMILIAIGVYTGYKHGFENAGSIILLLIGGFFLLRDKIHLPSHVVSYIIPVGLIILGLTIVFRRKKNLEIDWSKWEGNYDRWEKKLRTGTAKPTGNEDDKRRFDADFLNVDAIFCGLKRKVISKNFKGGEITTIFGGADIDFMHADIKDPAVLKVSVAFGGIKLIVPPHWDVQLGVSNIAAGVEDKRYVPQSGVDAEKKLIITGSVVFGGIEIISY